MSFFDTHLPPFKKELKNIGDKIFEKAMMFCNSINDNQEDLIRAALIVYRRVPDLGGIKKCADWLYARIDRTYYIERYHIIDMLIKTGNYPLIEEELEGLPKEYNSLVAFYSQILEDLQNPNLSTKGF